MTRTQRLYFNWLCDKVCEYNHTPYTSFRRLLTYLHETEFSYSLSMDMRRANDGLALRYRFSYETGELEDELVGACSIFEMMVALSIKCEECIMDDNEKGNRTAQWFWGMIVSLGLGDMTDIRYDEGLIDDVIYRFVERDYAPNGKGGLFTIRQANGPDMRKLHIWDQMLVYLNTIV